MTDFGTRIDELIAMIGDGELTGTLVVDQRYAQIQHEALDFKHPRGGGAMYLRNPLYLSANEQLTHIADQFLADGGREAMTAWMEKLSEDIKITAPVEFNNLRRSGHPIVTDGGNVIYDRQPEQHRLTDAEIDALKKLHPTGWITWHGDQFPIGPGG